MFLFASSEPWFSEWNHALLAHLFRTLPFTSLRIAIAEILTYNSLASTWIFAIVSYLYWRRKDEQTLWRRSRLIEGTIACWLVVLATLPMRPWISWPSPTRVPFFQDLYPSHLGTVGTADSFPSDSTLVYLMVALSFASLSRRMCSILVVFTLTAISFPRIYLGGHYPIDVLASIILALVAAILARLCSARPGMSHFLEWAATRGRVTEFFVFAWLFELGEGFRSGMDLLRTLLYWAHYAAR